MGTGSRASLLAAASVVAVTVACGTSTPSTSAPAEVAAFCSRMSEAMVQGALRCSGGSEHAIRLNQSLHDPCPDLLASVSQGRIVFHADHGQACLDSLGAPDCSLDLRPCAAAFEGRIAIGDGCYESVFMNECAGDAFCDSGSRPGCPSGTCRAFRHVGESCTSRDACEADVDAGPSTAECSMNNFCVAEGGEGAPCDLLSPCGRLFFCADGACRRASTTGPCSVSGEPHQCAPGSHCVDGLAPGMPGSCVPYKGLGEPCTPGLFECGMFTYCANDGTCTEQPGIGGACGDFGAEGAACLVGSCADGQCMDTHLPLGSRCDYLLNDPCEPEGSCTSSLCLPKCSPTRSCGHAGELCCADSEPNACSEGACQNGTCVVGWSCFVKGKCPNDVAPTADQVNMCQQAINGCCGDTFTLFVTCSWTNEQCDSAGNEDMQATANQCPRENAAYVHCVTAGCDGGTGR